MGDFEKLDLATTYNLWSHSMGDHTRCGSACPNKGKDLRPTLGYWEAMVKEYGDPFVD